MKLFLASEGKHPETINKLHGFIPDLKDKHVVYVPTAANGEYYGSWKGGESIQVVQALNVKKFEVVELENITYQNVLKQIEKADVLWIAGGMSGYLLYWFRRIELDKALPEMFAKGMVYVGSSAGSMICSKTQYSAEWYLGEPEPGAGLIPGLGLVDFEIYPHFEEYQLPQIKRQWKEGKLYLLKDGEVITVIDKKIEVLGEKKVLKD